MIPLYISHYREFTVTYKKVLIMEWFVIILSRMGIFPELTLAWVVMAKAVVLI